MSRLNDIENKIGYRFKDAALADVAFTHSSYVNEHGGVSNERMEFLGDGVLNFLVAEYLYKTEPNLREGELSARRAALVSRAPLSRIIDGLGFLEYLKVGAGVNKSAFSEKARSDLFEAIIGAVYLDGSLDDCRAVLDNIYFNDVSPELDYKTRLQEYAVRQGKTPSYTTCECADGFESCVAIGEKKYSGVGKTKHASQIAAAKSALSDIAIER